MRFTRQASALSTTLKNWADVKKFNDKMANLRKKWEDKMQKAYDT